MLNRELYPNGSENASERLFFVSLRNQVEFFTIRARGEVKMMRWIVKLMVFPLWLAVTLLLLLFRVASNLSSVVIGLAMLLGIVLGVVAAIGQRWTDVAIFACCEAAILLLQVTAVGIELLLETASERLGRVIAG